MTTTHAVESSVTVNNYPIQDYPGPDNHAPPSYKMTPGFKPFTIHCTFRKPYKSNMGGQNFIGTEGLID